MTKESNIDKIKLATFILACCTFTRCEFSESSLASDSVVAMMGMLKWATLLLIAVFVIVSSCTTVSAQPTVKIISPVNNSEAGPTQRITGTAQSIASGQTLWIFVYVPSVGRWYPQTPSVTVANDGSWTYRPGIGTSDDNGKNFLIQAVIADTTADNAINTYINTCRSTGSCPGMIALPQGAKVADEISVIRVQSDVPTSTTSASPAPSPSPSLSPSPCPSPIVSTSASGSHSDDFWSGPLPLALLLLAGVGVIVAIFILTYYYLRE